MSKLITLYAQVNETHLVSRHPGVVLVKVGLGPRPRRVAVRARVYRLLRPPVHHMLLLLLLLLIVGKFLDCM